MSENEECIVPKIIAGGEIQRNHVDISYAKFNPPHIGGWGAGEGDTHGDQVLEVPECPEN